VASVKLVLEYAGPDFSGWAAQPGLRTVEGVLSEAIEIVLGRPPALSVAGRTDAGVHAWGQVASFPGDVDDTRVSELARSLNGVLPPDVAVLAAAIMPANFDARRDARSRTYCYRLLARPAPSPFERGRALWWPHPLDRSALDVCARILTGKHDFTAFTPTRTDHVRFEREVIRAEWTRTGELLSFWIEADTFMRHMVRVLVGTMLEVAGARRSIPEFTSLLEGGPRQSAGETVEAHGLYLASVRY
jgi:tRNA pseudouridine38-40 synthase